MFSNSREIMSWNLHQPLRRHSGSARYATTALTTGCYYKFEAEFEDESYVKTGDNTDSQYWYGARNETVGDSLRRRGYVLHILGASYDYVWRCTPIDDTPPGGVPPIPGFPVKYCVYTDLRYRWLTTEPDNSHLNIRVGKEFPLYTYSNNPAEDFLYIRFHFRFIIPEGDTTPGNTVLLSFAPVGYKYANDGHSSVPTPILHTNGMQSAEETYLTLSDYDNMFEDQEERNVFKDIEIKISYQDLINNNLLITSPNNSACKILVNLNPRLYYHNHFTLDLDYIEIEDRMHRELRLNEAEHIAGIEQRMNVVRPSGYSDLVTNVYTVDEPTQPQFHSYDRIQEILQGINVKPMTAVQDLNFRKFNIDISNTKFYDHLDLFNKMAEPKIVMPDIYPIRADAIYQDWNSEGNVDNSLQWMLDKKLIAGYLSAKNPESGDADKLFYPVVQAFGHWDRNTWKSWILPPPAMQKMLQYLPLCFDADGIFNYRLCGLQRTDGSEMVGEYAACTAQVYVNNLSEQPSLQNYSAPTVFAPTYNAIQEANQKINVYSGIIKDPNMEWLGSNTVIVNSTYPTEDISALHLSGINISEPIAGECYHGYVQCGYYKDVYDFPSFMIVNRRANYFTSNDAAIVAPKQVPVSSYDQHFPPFGSQTVEFIPAPSAHTLFGTHIALYDPFDNALYRSEGLHTLVSIDAGDGKLLQMCASLPDTVSCNADLKGVAYLSGPITIHNGAVVMIHESTETTILPHSTIRVKGGSILNLAGVVNIADSVSIVVEPGGVINFNAAFCTWGEGSILKVTGGTLSINGGSMGTKSTSRWTGIRVSDSSQVLLENATISNAITNHIKDSDCTVNNCRFNVPAYSSGLRIENTSPGYHTEIINTMPGRGFYGTSYNFSIGIDLRSIHNQVNINNVNFCDLETGIYKDATPYAIDTVNECRFVNCKTGITLFFNGSSTVIEWSKFTNTQSGKNWTGINLIASTPDISNCIFDNLYCGVLSEYSIQSLYGTNHVYFHELIFKNCNRGIESRNSNHDLRANYFNRNNFGIVNHASSNLNLSYNANNVMMNSENNIVFYDTLPYQSTIQLRAGHNDFYHLRSAGGSNAVDFSFDANYYDSQGGFTVLRKINASDNWFEGAQVTVNDPLYAGYVYVDSYDLSPSMPPPGPNTDRLFMALDYESQGLYELAAATFKAIIDEELEDEKSDITSAIDGLYRCTFMMPEPSWELTDYFGVKALQFAIDDPGLSAILKDYLAKVFVNNKDFQAAVDLIQLRIGDPICEIDSLRAVLDLEIVLQLAAMEENKRPLTTEYVQYQYPGVQIFEKKHNDNWDKYSRLLHQNNADTSSLIAPIPLIQSNYPNPFNPSTTIMFSIPDDGRVRVSVYNLKGQKVKDLINADMPRGNHKLIWDGKDANNRNAGSGIYFLRLESGGKTSIRKAMLMK